MSEKKKIDYLKEDPELSGQKWVCLSFLTPENVEMKSDVRSVKVRGVYSTEGEARDRCEEIRQFDEDFNVYIAPVGKWLAWCDDPDKAEDFNYANDKLNDMMKGYYDNQKRAKQQYEERKKELMEGKKVDDSVLDKIMNDCQEEEENKTTVEEIDDQIKEQVEETKDLDDELRKAQELYEQLSKE